MGKIPSRHDDDNHHDAGSGDEGENDVEEDRALLWAKLFVAVVGHAFFTFYPSTQPASWLFLVARVVTFLLSLATLAWMAASFVLCQKYPPTASLPVGLALAWLLYGCILLVSLSVGGGPSTITVTGADENVLLIILTPLMSLGATAYYTICLADFLPVMQRWKARRKIRFISWATFALACAMNLVFLSPMILPDNNDRDSQDLHPTNFIWVASWAMQVFLLIHALAALYFYWRHEKVNIILENRLVRPEREGKGACSREMAKSEVDSPFFLFQKYRSCPLRVYPSRHSLSLRAPKMTWPSVKWVSGSNPWACTWERLPNCFFRCIWYYTISCHRSCCS